MPNHNDANTPSAWDNDELQFCRLVAEISMMGLSEEDQAVLCDSMDLEPYQLQILFRRAEVKWKQLKELYKRKRLYNDWVNENNKG